MSSAYQSALSSPELGGERLSYNLNPIDEQREWGRFRVGSGNDNKTTRNIRKIMAGTIRLLFPILKYIDEDALPSIDEDLRQHNLQYVNSS